MRMRLDRGEQVALVLGVVTGVGQRVDDGRERWDVPDHRHGAVLRVQRQREAVLLRERVDRRLLRRLDPVLRDAVAARLLDDRGVVRVEQQVELGLVEVLLVLDRRGGHHLVGVVEEEAEVAQPTDARLGADGGLADLDARVAHRALLGLAGAVVEVDLLVGAARDAHAPAAAHVLVDEHDAVLGPLVHRARRAGGDARRVEAVLADARQVEHEGLLELERHLVLDALEHRVLVPVLGRAAEVVVPVRAPADLHVLAGDHRLRPSHGHGVHRRGADQGVVVVGPRLVVVVEAGELGVAEDLGEPVPPAAAAQAQLAALVEDPPALPLLLVLVAARVALTGPRLDVVEPHVLDAAPVRPRLLARDRAGVAPDALVEVHHHAHLGHDSRHQY